MSIDTILLEKARSEIDDLCGKVGFHIEQLPKFKNLNIEPPPGTTLWVSDYAAVLLWPIDKTSAGPLQIAAEQGQSYFDELLVTKEGAANGRVVDGYLLLALPSAPTNDVQPTIRRLELSSQICRKHILWPKGPEELHQPAVPTSMWARIADVTVLGLPDANTAGSADVYWPQLDKEAEKLWRELENGNPVVIAQQDGGEDL
jgi:hypothetical protein